jgi:hypothetical protein
MYCECLWTEDYRVYLYVGQCENLNCVPSLFPSFTSCIVYPDFKYIIHQPIQLTSGSYRIGRIALEPEMWYVSAVSVSIRNGWTTRAVRYEYATQQLTLICRIFTPILSTPRITVSGLLTDFCMHTNTSWQYCFGFYLTLQILFAMYAFVAQAFPSYLIHAFRTYVDTMEMSHYCLKLSLELCNKIGQEIYNSFCIKITVKILVSRLNRR